ncbi:MAG: hypothetical protein V4671_10480, partial [Armatimonadota bacterium]
MQKRGNSVLQGKTGKVGPLVNPDLTGTPISITLYTEDPMAWNKEQRVARAKKKIPRSKDFWVTVELEDIVVDPTKAPIAVYFYDGNGRKIRTMDHRVEFTETGPDSATGTIKIIRLLSAATGDVIVMARPA